MGVGHHPTVEALSTEQCTVHLETAVYGRVVYTTARGPVAIPVNLFLADHTVKNYITGLLRKLKMTSRTEAAIYATKLKTE